MKFYNGYENISVELISMETDLARKCFDFGKHGEFYNYSKIKYDENDPICKKIIDDIMTGKTFPKYAFEGHNVAFKVNNISRICLAQFTREKGFFCSESGDVRPLTQELIIPKAIYENEEWVKRYKDINKELEHLYCDIAKSGITFMDSRYIMPHCQTISLSYCTSAINFVRSFAKRVENCIGDEINYIYRLMKHEIEKQFEKMDSLSEKLWKWLLEMGKPKKPYLNDVTFTNAFDMYPTPEGYEFPEKAHNDYTKSSWKIELENIYINQPELLFEEEKKMIERWHTIGMNSTYDKTMPYTLYTSIEQMAYYKEYINEKRYK